MLALGLCLTVQSRTPACVLDLMYPLQPWDTVRVMLPHSVLATSTWVICLAGEGWGHLLRPRERALCVTTSPTIWRVLRGWMQCSSGYPWDRLEHALLSVLLRALCALPVL